MSVQAPVAKVRFWRGGSRQSDIVIMGVVAVLCALQLLLAPHFAFFGDDQAYVYWGELTRSHFLHVYSLGAANGNWILRPNYGPVAMYLFGIVGWIYSLASSMFGLSAVQRVPANASLTLFIKAPAFIAHLAMVGVLYGLGRRVMPAKWAVVAVTTYALCPAVLIDVTLWGQTDCIILLGLVLTLVCVQDKRGLWAGVIFALTVCFKSQPIVFLPFLVAYFYRWAGLRQLARGAAGFVGTAIVVWLPYLLPPHPEILVWKSMLSVLANERPYASDGAFNLWWLLGMHLNPAKPFVGPVSPNLLGAALLGVFILIAIAGIWRDGSPGAMWTGAGLVAVAFFVVMTLQRERYFLPAVPILLVAALYERRKWPLYAGVAFATSVNVGLVFLQPPQIVGAALSAWASGLVERYPLVYVALCLATVGVNLWLLICLAYFQLRRVGLLVTLRKVRWYSTQLVESGVRPPWRALPSKDRHSSPQARH